MPSVEGGDLSRVKANISPPSMSSQCRHFVLLRRWTIFCLHCLSFEISKFGKDSAQLFNFTFCLSHLSRFF